MVLQQMDIHMKEKTENEIWLLPWSRQEKTLEKKKLRSISSWSKMGKNFRNGTQKALAVEEKINKSEQIKFRNSSS